MNELIIQEFNNFGYMMADLPLNLKNMLLNEADYIQNNFDKAVPRNKSLAGHIKHEYSIEKSADALEDFVLQLANEYDQHYKYFAQIDILTGNLPIVMKNPWINFQAKHEFNPVHNHRGILSFVSWLNIPYNLKDEIEQGPGQLNNDPVTSLFQFIHVNSLGQIALHKIPVDKSFEGKIMIFPAKMMHCVYPFYTSDEYRISVAGNVMLQSN